jgi:hypothetical protein
LLLQHGFPIKCFPDLQNKDLTDMLPEVEDLLSMNSSRVKQRWFLDEGKRKEIAAKNSSLFWSFRKSSDAK